MNRKRNAAILISFGLIYAGLFIESSHLLSACKLIAASSLVFLCCSQVSSSKIDLHTTRFCLTNTAFFFHSQRWRSASITLRVSFLSVLVFLFSGCGVHMHLQTSVSDPRFVGIPRVPDHTPVGDGNDVILSAVCVDRISVQNVDDSGAGSLRQAIADLCDGGVIDFAAGLSGQTVTLTSGELSLTQTATITSSVPITISGNNASRMFNIDSSGVITLTGLTLRDGNADFGGGIHNNGGTLAIASSRIFSNTATESGGGIYNNGGTVSLTDSHVQYNEAHGNGLTAGGGGLYNSSGSMTLKAAEVWDNVASGSSGSGGGLFILSGAFTTTHQTTFDRNAANRAGGGIEIVDGSILAITVHLRSNNVNGSAGTPAPGHGGGLHVTGSSAVVTLLNSVVVGNQAAEQGGGIWLQTGATLEVQATQVVGNRAFANGPAGGAIYNNGGFVFLDDDPGPPTLIDNRAAGINSQGGAVYSQGGTVSVRDIVRLDSNSATGYGGGFAVVDATLLLTNVMATGNQAGGPGGLIYAENSTVTIDDSEIDSNQSSTSGGAIAISGASSALTITNSSVFSNTAANFGGGIHNSQGRVEIASSTVSSNTATSQAGGGIRSTGTGAVLLITNSTVENNLAGGGNGGGALYSDGTGGNASSVSVQDSILRSNKSTGHAGAAITVISTEQFSVTGSVFTDNTMSGGSFPGAVYSKGAEATVTGNCFVGNSDVALQHIGSPNMDATGNWWGSVSGPSGDGPGSGDSVAGNVDFAPFLSSAILGCDTSDADLSLLKSADSTSAQPGSTITYTLRFTNSGPAIATGVVISDSLPVSVTLTAVTSTTIGAGVLITQTASAPDLVWTVSDLPVGAGGVITLTGALDGGLAVQTIVNTATITATNDITATNNSASASLHVNGTIYVDTDAIGAATGISWTNAFTNVQDALTFAESGDEIWVAEGVYYPDEGAGQTDNDVAASFVLTDGVALYGGFAATETLRSERNWQSNITVLSGDIDADSGNADTTDPTGVVTDTANIQGNNAYNVVVGSGTDGTTILDGFVVTAGHAHGPYVAPCGRRCGGGMFNESGSPTVSNVTFSGNSGNHGGGMYNDHSSPTVSNVTFSTNSAVAGGGMYNLDNSSPTISDVTFKGNSANNWGGGMFNTINSSPTMRSVTFSDNSAGDHGGGMYNKNDSSPTVSNVTFSGNSSRFLGGGMYNDGSSPTVSNVTFSGNASDGGAGVYNIYSNPTISNVTFSGNTASDWGGGMYNSFNATPMMSNVTFSGNSAGNTGGAMYNDRNSSPTIVNSILWNNAANGSTITVSASIFNDNSSPTISYSVVANSGGSGGSWDSAAGVDGGNNLDVDTQFVADVDPATAPTTTGDLRLQPSSPAIDAGDNATCAADDLRGAPRPQDGNGDGVVTCDMGAYEADGIATIAYNISDASVVEGDSDTVDLTFTITRSGSAVNGSVVVSTTDGTAEDGLDYVGITETVAFAIGVTSQTVTVTVNGDSDIEPDETLTATLSVVVNGVISDGTGIGTIENDDDLAPAVVGHRPISDALDIPLTASVVVTFSEPVSVTSPITLSCDGNARSVTQTMPDTATVALTPDQPLPAGELCVVTVPFDTVEDDDTIDPPDNLAATYVFSFTTTIADSPPSGNLRIEAFTYQADPNDSVPGGTLDGYILLKNVGNAPLNVQGFMVGDEETSGGDEGMYELPDYELAAGETLIIAEDADHYAYADTPDYSFAANSVGVPVLQLATRWSNGPVDLDNDSDEVILLNNDLLLEDGVCWGIEDELCVVDNSARVQTRLLDDGRLADNPAIAGYQRVETQDTNLQADWLPDQTAVGLKSQQVARLSAVWPLVIALLALTCLQSYARLYKSRLTDIPSSV